MWTGLLIHGRPGLSPWTRCPPRAAQSIVTRSFRNANRIMTIVGPGLAMSETSRGARRGARSADREG
jgi:hypothetical protein